MTADPLAFIRGAHFAATLLASGTVCFMALVTAPRRPHDFAALQWRMNVMVWIGLALAVVTGAAWLIVLAADILGEPLIDALLHGSALPVIAGTRFGWIWCLRGALAVLLALFVLDPKRRNLQVTAAAAFLVLPALVGHAGAAPGLIGVGRILSDTAHLTAAGLWLGALPAFAALLRTAGRKRARHWPEFAVATTRRFSTVAAACVAILLVSGILNAWALLGGLRDLWTTDYGQLLGLKVLLLAAMVAIASVNKFRLAPRLPAPAALRTLRRNSLAEAGIGLCVLLLVGFLGQLQPSAHTHPAGHAVPADAAYTHIHTSEAMAEVTISPGHIGPAGVQIRVLREDFSNFAAKEVRLILEPPGSGPALQFAAEQQPDGTWAVAEVVLAQPGVWTVRVFAIGQSGETIALDAPVAINR